MSNEKNVVTDEQLIDIIEENLDDYKVDNTIPNYVISDLDESILKTEIHICSKCMFPDIIGTEPFNRRQIEQKQFRLDNIVHSAFMNFARTNKLNQNSALALLLRIANDPIVYKNLMGSFSGISKRKGKNNRSKEVIKSS